MNSIDSMRSDFVRNSPFREIVKTANDVAGICVRHEWTPLLAFDQRHSIMLGERHIEHQNVKKISCPREQLAKDQGSGRSLDSGEGISLPHHLHQQLAHFHHNS